MFFLGSISQGIFRPLVHVGQQVAFEWEGSVVAHGVPLQRGALYVGIKETFYQMGSDGGAIE